MSEDQPEQAIEPTNSFSDVDTLAVLHAIAMTRLNPKQSRLLAELQQRFTEPRWRGDFLHHREYASSLLDVKGDAKGGLVVA